MFYVAPLFLIALARLGRPRRAAAACAAPSRPRRSPRCSPLAIPFERFIDDGRVSDTLALLPFWWRSRHTGSRSIVVDGRARGGSSRRRSSCSCRAATRSCCRRSSSLYFASCLQPIWSERPHGFEQASARRALPGDPRGAPGLDRPRRADGAPWSRRSGRASTDRFTVKENEFFNRSVGPVYDIGAPDARRAAGDGGRRSTTATAPSARRRPAARAPGTSSSTARSTPDGGAVARDPRLGHDALARRRAARRDARRVDGPLPGRHVVGPDGDLHARRAAAAAPLAVALASDPASSDGRQTVTASPSAGAVVARTRAGPTAQRTLRVPLAPERRASARVASRVAPHRVPAR